MINKTWDIDVVGVLASEEYVREKTGKSCVFVNSQNSIQFSVRLISETPETFPNQNLFTGFSSNLAAYAFEDHPWEDQEVRRQALVNFLEDKLLVFRPQRKTRPDADEVYQITEVRTHPKTDAYRDSTTYIPVPVFGEGKHGVSESEFLEKLQSERYVGKIEHISTELNDTPTYVVWRGRDGSLTVYGEFERHLYANGGFSFKFNDLKRTEFREEWFDDAFSEGDILFVSLDVYNHMADAMHTGSSAAEIVSLKESTEIGNEIAATSAPSVKGNDVMMDKPVLTNVLPISRTDGRKDLLTEDRSEAAFLEHFMQSARERNLLYSDTDLINFHTAMKSSTLVILAGMSGTGKSRLVEVYGRALGMDSEQLNIIPVRPAWTDDADLIGYVDSIHNVYRPGDSGLIDTLKQAQDNPDKLYIICFDEMNLARVEHYFSQFLSVLEMPQGRRELRLYNEDLMTRLYNYKEYRASITIGSNVMFVGTVNLDESTHHFSDKVLDRANVITLHVLPFHQLKQVGDRRVEKSLRRAWSTEDFSAFRNTSEGIQLTNDELSILEEIHQLFQSIDFNRGIGYRIVRQIDAYLKNLPTDSALSRDQALDLQVVQRVMTKVRGSEDQLRRLLGTYQKDNDAVSESLLLQCLDRFSQVSDFKETRKVIGHKAKELRLHGYTI
ncbi:AAA family ATPase [Alicyclobacillus fastidiosus]|uniref:AAA family ATPase n=1 Tax=Alicyclobacillus fastidiosus TaxID=392011 RepID=A0ABY6ZQI9_9BACL|nr:AAA family ATPase [Alicyclobacillus fastidiosus]WAH44381.1 AAA family ATPase [Alicyclobacillus fastidiosus]GMA60716.1 hypothetical protein GCM10025859_11560 [Alicyclobacillus fastidiosus]